MSGGCSSQTENHYRQDCCVPVENNFGCVVSPLACLKCEVEGDGQVERHVDAAKCVV